MLTPKQQRKLKAQAHPLKPVILVGAKGITESLIAELDHALSHHELLKVKFASEDRGERKEQIIQCCQQTNAYCVDTIGKTAILYREKLDD